MKLPFRSRLPVDDFDFDELDDLSLDDQRHDVSPVDEADYPDADLGVDLDFSQDPDPDEGLVSFDDDDDDDLNVGEAVSANEFSDEMERLRSEASAEQRSAWAYLGVLTAVFLLLVLLGYVLSDVRGTDVEIGADGETVGAAQPSQLVFQVDGDVITLEGTLPDEASKAQVLALVQDQYGAANVLDQLVVDEAFSFDSGTIRMVGSAAFGDERPMLVEDAVSSDFGLANRGFEVGFVETVLSPVNALVQVVDGRAELSGALPDQQSIDDLVGLAASVWGPANVDAALLTIGETSWTDGRLRLTGNAASSDPRIDSFVRGAPERIAATVTVDTTGLVVDDIGQLINEVQTEVNALVAADPVTFAPLQTAIDPASDSVLVEVANQVNRLGDTQFEVVGHTDDAGNDQENLLLSQDRAKAVVDRLVELGVAAERVSSRGEGETKPVGDNSSAAGRAANRRIEFVLVGASDG